MTSPTGDKQMKTAYVEIRSQRPKGTWPSQGPDTYVAVQIVPAGVARLKCLNRRAAEARGIEIVYCGEGYSNRCATTRSMLGAAIAAADRLALEIRR